MVMLPQEYTQGQFDPNTSGGGKAIVPNDNYKAMIVESEMKQTSNGRGQYLQLKVVICDGQYQGTEFIERLNLVNDSDVARQIAARRLDAICAALGYTSRPSNSADLHGKHFIVETTTKKGEAWTDNNGVEREGSDYSEIKKFLPVPKVGQAQQAPANTASPQATGSNPFQPAQEQPHQVTDNNKPPF